MNLCRAGRQRPYPSLPSDQCYICVCTTGGWSHSGVTLTRLWVLVRAEQSQLDGQNSKSLDLLTVPEEDLSSLYLIRDTAIQQHFLGLNTQASSPWYCWIRQNCHGRAAPLCRFDCSPGGATGAESNAKSMGCLRKSHLIPSPKDSVYQRVSKLHLNPHPTPC